MLTNHKLCTVTKNISSIACYKRTKNISSLACYKRTKKKKKEFETGTREPDRLFWSVSENYADHWVSRYYYQSHLGMHLSYMAKVVICNSLATLFWSYMKSSRFPNFSYSYQHYIWQWKLNEKFMLSFHKCIMGRLNFTLHIDKRAWDQELFPFPVDALKYSCARASTFAQTLYTGETRAWKNTGMENLLSEYSVKANWWKAWRKLT